MEYTATISPNEKYRFVINGETDRDGFMSEEEWEDQPHTEAADAYLRVIDNAPTAEQERIDTDPDHEGVSWSNFSVSKDPDLVSKMATYFDGVDPDEPTDLIRAKLRLIGDPQIYANAQIAANAELRNEQPAPA